MNTADNLRKNWFIYLFSQVSVQNDLIFLKSHLFVLVQTIKNLENSNLPFTESVKMVQNIISSMQSIPGIKVFEIKNKILLTSAKK